MSVVLVIGLFVMTFIFQNFEIPSASMVKTLVIGDHVLVDRTTLAPQTKWMPLVHYRSAKRGDIIVFLKPHPETPDLILVKRLIGIAGDRIGKAALLEEMSPYQGGGDMISSVTFEKTTYNKIPHKFEA